MKLYLRMATHDREVVRLERKYRDQLTEARTRHANELKAADATGYARGLMHGWNDALTKFRVVVGRERAELIQEWRDAVIARANRKHQRRR